ncbi:DUF2851 family protein [uncultured Lutibacter sp.]|uniref:DUF2851 family protein n=1 Tax=uncultured Lutibacter sp. TaxID=437739 RepID=UPI00262E3733|nr:DUF2851 family protein [uncultured Lutibacter sp.]
MKENLLHFIWKLKLFPTSKIKTTSGELLEIKSSGLLNYNSGPDFLNAQIRIQDQLWAGNVEIHLKSSDWYIHRHEKDESYDSVILHVVWEHDVTIFRKSNKTIPTLELKNYISKELLENYQKLFSTPKKWINCEQEINRIDSFILEHWYERLYFERLEQKSVQVQDIFIKTNNNWEATLFSLLAKSFGLNVNGEAFLDLALSVDFTTVRKVSNNLNQFEALLFGQAGLLFDNIESNYFFNLKEEFKYLQTKFKLEPISKNQIQFFRLRPNNFPTIRISQLSQLYHTHQNLFSKVIENEKLEEFYELFSVSASTFWETHYTFSKESKKSIKKITKPFIDLVLINTVIPIKFWYLKSLGKNDFSSLLQLIQQMKPEKNSIISNFNMLKVKSDNAFKTQALLQLKNEYCSKQRCLECSIGKELLKN